MKKILITLIVLAAVISCGKMADSDITGNEKVIGRLFLLDTLTQNALKTPLSGKKVLIRSYDSPDQINYLFSTTTDANGYFTFGNLTKDKKYKVVYQETVNGISYAGDTSATAPVNTTVVIAKIDSKNQKGVIFTVKDFSGNILKDASICIFTSSGNIGYTAAICDGSSYQLKTDANGHANLFGLNSGNYYFIAASTVNQIPLSFKGAFTIKDTVEHPGVTLNKPNGIHFITQDINSQPIGNVQMCVFTSNVLFQRGSCDGSNFQVVSGSSGLADKYALSKGTYYVFSQIVFGKDTLIAKNTVTVGDAISNCVLQLVKK